MKNKDIATSFLRRQENSVKNLFCETANFKKFVIYSYGYHFPLSVLLEDDTIIINSDGYSQTTAQHKGLLCRELGFDNFKDLEKNHEKNILLLGTNEIKNIISNSKINSVYQYIAEEI